MTKTAGVSLADLNVRTASEHPFEFEYVGPDAKPSGLWFKVLGAQSQTVTEETNRLVNERRRQDALRAAKAVRSGRNADPDPTPVEDDIAFAQRLNAVRLVGWRAPGDVDGLTAEQAERFQGISDPYSADNALLLIRTNPDIADQVSERSGALVNFMRGSSTAS